MTRRDRQNLAALIALVIVLCAIATLIPLGGCRADLPSGGSAVSAPQSLIRSATADVGKAKPHADAIGKAHLDSATTDLGTADKQLDEVAAQLRAVEGLKAELASVKQTLADERTWWISYRVWSVIDKIIIGGLVLLLFQVICIGIGLSSGGSVATFIAMMGRTVGIAIPVLGALANWIADHIWLRKQSVVTVYKTVGA